MASNIADFNLTDASGDSMGSPNNFTFSPDPATGGGSGGGGGNFGNIAAGLGGAAALGVGAYDLFKGNPDSAPVQSLKGEAGLLGNEAASLVTQGQGYEGFLQSGTLPGPQQAKLEMAQNAAKARIIQGDAKRGQNTDPMHNSGLTQDLNSLSLQTESEKVAQEKALFDAGQSLIKEGNTAMGMEVGIQEKLAEIDAKQQADTTNAIMGFAKSLGSMNWGSIGTGLSSLGSSISSGLSGLGTAAAAGDIGAVAAEAAPLALL